MTLLGDILSAALLHELLQWLGMILMPSSCLIMAVQHQGKILQLLPELRKS